MADPEINFARDVGWEACQEFATASRLEWLETNGTGAFAMGTVAGVNTRRYHGLLIASMNQPADRYSIFPRVEETVEFEGKTFPLAAVQYPGTVSPAGYELIESFSHVPHATWRYRCDGLRIEKSLRLVSGKQAVVVSYRGTAQCKIQIRLFLSFRDYHTLTHCNTSLDTRIEALPDGFSMCPYSGLPSVTFHSGGARLEPDGLWFKNHEYLRELERGLDFREDLYSPGVLHVDLQPDIAWQFMAELETGAGVARPAAESVVARPLARALDQFRVWRADGKPTLIAGYPWFTDWSRDTLISLPAFIAAGFPATETREILAFLLAERKQGILPNRFSDNHSTAEYNTVDASLWFFIAADAYVEASGDHEFVQSTLLDAALDIIDWHRRGTFYGIGVDAADHLLAAGQAGTQLTWMDAKIGDYVVTPRMGKAVEINALWFNALRMASKWALQGNKPETDSELLEESAAVQASFMKKFWNPKRSCLYDVVTADGPDESLRPNQLFAVSLPYPLTGRAESQAIVRIVRELLLTPAGLRTLEPADPRYRARFAGDMASRDSAYHQGTVWPWLIGPYVSAYLNAFDDSPEAIRHCREVMNSIVQLMNSYCLGTIGEVYDAEAPHQPGGCPAQLWSVAQSILALRRIENS